MHDNSSSSWKAIVLHLKNWQVVTGDQWVLINTVQGYSLELHQEPGFSHAHPPLYSVKQSSLIEEEIRALLQKGAITEVREPGKSFHSNLFLVPNKDGP